MNGLDPGGEMGGYGGELSVFESLGAPAYAPYDPFAGMTPSAIAGGYAKNLPVAAYTPEPDWLARVWQPVDAIWGTGEKFVEQALERAPDLLWGYASRKVDEGAGVTVIHSQAPQPGGTPAQPVQKVIPGPGQFPFYTPGAPQQAAGTGTMILIGAGLLVLFILTRK